MLFTLKRITIAVFSIYCLLTCYTAYLLLFKNSSNQEKRQNSVLPEEEEDWNPWGEELQKEGSQPIGASQRKPSLKWSGNRNLDFGKQFNLKPLDSKEDEGQPSFNVEVWGKAAIGLYLWEHILEGKLERKMDGIWSYGFKKINSIKFKFRTGPGVIPSKVPTDVENLLLVLNGMNQEKISFARMWLDFLHSLPQLRNVILVILGNEQCQNDWLLPYMEPHGGLVNVTFLIYDSPWVDKHHVYQWPLGVATYRNFPNNKEVDLESSRPFTCNFIGTIYPKSSRQQLVHILHQHQLDKICFVKTRQQWQPQETKDTQETYIQTLKLSDLTLSPVGINSECYRIYEAISMGSVPVVEDSMTSGKCGPSPLRLLKELEAPLIYVKNWSELPDLLEREKATSAEEKVARRLNLARWYQNFKHHLRDTLVGVLEKQFFGEKVS